MNIKILLTGENIFIPLRESRQTIDPRLQASTISIKGSKVMTRK